MAWPWDQDADSMNSPTAWFRYGTIPLVVETWAYRGGVAYLWRWSPRETWGE